MFTASPFQSETSATASSALDMLALNHSVRGDRGRHHLPEHLDRYIATGLEIDGQVGVGQIAPRREAVAAAPQPADHLAFMQHRLATVNGNVVVAAHLQRAQPPRNSGAARCQQPFAAVELRLVETNAETESRLERVVEQCEVGAVVAVALFHPEPLQDAVPAGPDARRAPCRHQPVPDLPGPRRLDVQLPTKLAYVRHPLGKHGGAADPYGPRVHEREAVICHVVGGHALENVPRGRSPHADDREILRRLAEVDGGISILYL